MSQVSIGRGEEPPMFLQRPSTGKSQDVRHILAKTFRQLYTRDAIGPDTVKNLAVSKGGDDPYHEKYVEALQKVFNERQRRMEEAAMLERHIMQAQARAMSADERELNRTAQSCDNYAALGLPPGRSNFRRCIDTQLLQKHKLLTPEDYATEEPAPVPPPMAPKIPSYARDTVTSRQHLREEDLREESPLPFQRSKSDMGFPSIASAEEGTDLSELKEREYLSKFPRNDAWKSQMNEEKREQERISLNNLRAKVEYKRNPRHVPPSAPAGGRTLIKAQNVRPKEIGIQVKPRPPSEPKEPSTVFLLSPPVVVFSDYKVGQVYELTLTLKNVSACIRQCRALPVSTPYFSVGLGQFPGEHGLVAPGMSCHYAIRFAPDSLRDFDDEIKIQTQSTNPIIVPIRGRRQPPKLTVPSLIDVGYCLVGGCQVTQLIVKNEGGYGKFCILPSTTWPTTNFKSVVRNGNVSVPPFDVRPSVLELGKDEAGIMEVVFQPTAVKVYNVDIALVCDNCNVKHFTLKGEAQKAAVELVSVERGMSEPLPGELNDATAKHLIKFDNLNPFTYTDRNTVVKNTTNIALPFQWMIYKPQFDLSDDGTYKKMDRVPDVDSVFSVHPPSGMLPPAESMEFKITFAPPVVDSFHSALHLLLNMVPPSVQETSKRSSATEKSSQESGSPTDEDDNLSEILLQQLDMAPFGDVTALEIEVKGESTPLNVVVHPWAVHVPGKNLVGITLKKMVTMANHSRSTITFQWEPYTDSYILEVEPPFGELDPGMAMDMELCITGPEPGKIDHTLYCHVMNLEEPITLQVQAEFKGPEVLIEEPDLNFGLVQLGQVVAKEITLCNMAQIITQWTIQDSPAFASSEDDMAVSELTFEPASGELKPLERRKVTVMFNPQSAKSVKRVLEVTVEDGEDCNIACYAEVQVTQVCLVSCEVSIPECYKGVPTTAVATLLNQTLLPTVFEWGQVQGNDAKDCSIQIEPKMGGLGPREEKSTIINFTANREGEFSELRVPCKIDGMKEALVMAIYSDVKGLSLRYFVTKDGEISEDSDGDLKLDFGSRISLGSTEKLYLHVRNQTAITAPYSFSLENFFTKPPTPPDQTREMSQSRAISQRRIMLGKTPNLADPFSKTSAKAQADLAQAMLCQAQGAAFVPTPATGYLTPFGEEVIEVTAYSDIWGQYSDNLLCKVGELEVTKIPVSLNVVGWPLSFQMTAGQPNFQPVVRFGTHVAGTSVCRRNMRVNNNSPFDIRVDWEVFNIDKSDEKLLDLIVYFGHAFPKRDADGNEIVPPKEVPAPVVRQPTDFIPNSEDTTPAASREVTKSSITQEKRDEDVVMATKRPNVVSVFCRAHEGQKSNSPYSISPPQLMIPAKGHANVTVSFTPQPTGEVAKDTECPGFALGYMSLDEEKSADVESKVKRPQGFLASELRLDMTALIKPALLTIEPADEEGMRYRSAMSNLLREDGQLLPESLQTCSVMLSNLTLTPLTFRLLTKQPFLLVDLDPGSNRDRSTRTQTTDMHTLKPRHNLIVKVAFQTTTGLLSEIADEYLNAENGSETGENSDGSKKIDIKDNLIVEFNNSAQQLVPLHATLTIPQFYLSKESLDFGTCLVGQKRELQFLIYNETSSHSYWSVSQETMSETCAMDTFMVEPATGLLEAHITHVSDSKSLLRLFFTAKHAEDYEAVFTFHGVLGEIPQRLYVRGQGSYDGKHEAILNV